MKSVSEPRMWQLFKNGAFIFTMYHPLDNAKLTVSGLTDIVRECIDFTSTVYTSSGQEERLCSVRLAVHGESSFAVDFGTDGQLECGKEGATAEICRSAADLVSAPEVHAGRMIRKFSAGLEDSVS